MFITLRFLKKFISGTLFLSDMSERFLVINFKNYRSSIGSRAVKLAMMIEEISYTYIKKGKNKIEIFLVVEPGDVFKVSHTSSLKVFSVADPVDFGRHTGAILAEDLKDNGSYGLLINHSENKLSFEGIKFLVIKARTLRLKSMVCCRNLKELKKIVKLKPDFIAIEPEKLIGGNLSVSRAKPRLISKAYEITSKSKIPLLCGAGVKTDEDVAKAIQLGSAGVLVASGIVNAKNKKRALKTILKGF